MYFHNYTIKVVQDIYNIFNSLDNQRYSKPPAGFGLYILLYRDN